MLNLVEAITDYGVTLSLPFMDITNGYSVQDIQGLDPVPANIVSSSFANLDGEQYQSSRREKRNIILKLGLEPDFTTMTVRELRSHLYGFFMPKQSTNLRFYTDGAPTVDIAGRIETFDCPIFVKEPVATVSILCFDPDFYDPIEVMIDGATNFPATVSPGPPPVYAPPEFMMIDYEGTVDTGILFELFVNRPMDGFTIQYQPDGDQVREMDVAASLLADDVVRISTQPGNKYATLTRGGVLSSILYGVSPYADWVRLQPGSNAFRVNSVGDPVPYDITYTNKFGGL